MTTLKKTGMQDDSSDDEKLDNVIKDALMRGGSAIYAKGDKIQVHKGDFTGIKGQVVSIEDAHITFTAIGIPQLTKQLTVEVSMVSKYFEPGDMVRIIEAKYKGETGQVIDVEASKVSVVLDVSQQEIKIYANYLKLKSETDTNLVAALNHKTSFQAKDLVNFNGNKHIGLVLQVHEDYLKIID